MIPAIPLHGAVLHAPLLSTEREKKTENREALSVAGPKRKC